MKAPLQPGKSFGSAASSATAQRKSGLKTVVNNQPSAIAQRKLQGLVQKKKGAIEKTIQRVIIIGEKPVNIKPMIANKELLKKKIAAIIKTEDDTVLETVVTGLESLDRPDLNFEYDSMQEVVNAIHTEGASTLIEIQEAINASYQSISSYKQKAKEEKWESSKVGKEEEESSEQKHVRFPHEGKHCAPPFKAKAAIERQLENWTAQKNQAALYKSRDAATVIGWEQTAIDHGFELSDGFTFVHAFAEPIGADQGTMTRFIRMEGHHHGHPIHESEGLANFDGYIKKEISDLLQVKNTEKLKGLFSWLKKNNLNVNFFLNSVPKNIQPQIVPI